MTNRRRCATWVAICVSLAGCAVAPPELAYDAWRHHPDSTGHGGGWYQLTDTGPKGYSTAANILDETVDLRIRSRPFALADFPPKSGYWIVNPDNRVHTDAPNYITDGEIDALVAFVERGGALILFGNDPANSERTHFNRLAGRFGLHFNADETGDEPVTVARDDRVFHRDLVVQYMWGCTIDVDETVEPDFVVRIPDDRPVHGPVIVGLRFGKGKVVAAGDSGMWSNQSIRRRDTEGVFRAVMRWARP